VSDDAMTHELAALRKLVTTTAHADADGHGVPLNLDDYTAEAVARAILAAGYVRLPEIADTDDTLFWATVSDQRLRSEIACDLWNAAAGLHEQRRRDISQAVKLSADVAVFSGAVQP
jgi:hypothetical protein